MREICIGANGRPDRDSKTLPSQGLGRHPGGKREPRLRSQGTSPRDHDLLGVDGRQVHPVRGQTVPVRERAPRPARPWRAWLGAAALVRALMSARSSSAFASRMRRRNTSDALSPLPSPAADTTRAPWLSAARSIATRHHRVARQPVPLGYHQHPGLGAPAGKAASAATSAAGTLVDGRRPSTRPGRRARQPPGRLPGPPTLRWPYAGPPGPGAGPRSRREKVPNGHLGRRRDLGSPAHGHNNASWIVMGASSNIDEREWHIRMAHSR